MSGGQPLAPQQATDQIKGKFLLVRYDIPGELTWHCRLVLGHVTAGEFVILTPQGDIYAEDYGNASLEVATWRLFKPAGPLPLGVDPAHVHQFNPLPDAATIARLLQEGEVYVSMERLQRGLPLHQGPAAAVVGQPGPAAVGAGGAVAGGPLGGRRCKSWWRPLCCSSRCACSSRPTIGCHCSRFASPKPGHSWSRPRGRQNFEHQGCPEPAVQRVQGCGSRMQGGGVCRLASGWAQDSPSCSLTNCGTWRLSGCPLTSVEDCVQVSTYRQAGPGPRNAVSHFADYGRVRSARCFQHRCSRDGGQRDSKDRKEQRKLKLTSSEDAGESSLFLGSVGGSRAGTCNWPKLSEWIGSEMAKEATVAKERRKARECALKEERKNRQGQRQVMGLTRTSPTRAPSWLSLLLTFLTFFHVADAGIVDDFGRTRNILPLPDLFEDAGGGQGSDFWKPFASQGIKALNELSGCVDFDNSFRRKTSRAQRRVLSLNQWRLCSSLSWSFLFCWLWWASWALFILSPLQHWQEWSYALRRGKHFLAAGCEFARPIGRLRPCCWQRMARVLAQAYAG